MAGGKLVMCIKLFNNLYCLYLKNLQNKKYIKTLGEKNNCDIKTIIKYSFFFEYYFDYENLKEIQFSLTKNEIPTFFYLNHLFLETSSLSYFV